MEKIPPPSADDARKTRSDGAQSRERLLMAAMRLFAEKGFANTSTREIALAAGTNIASISYYFGDKAGLYRAAFNDPAPRPTRDLTALAKPGATLRESLTTFYGTLLEPLKQGDRMRLCMRLWYREMLEPTGVWHEEVDNGIKPAHAALVQILCRHMNLAAPTHDIERLAFNVVGMAIHMIAAREVIEKVSPHLLATDEAIDTWLARLVDHALAMVDAERLRLAALAPVNKPQPRKKKIA